MTIALLTGGSGFIGLNIAQGLVKRGIRVISLSRTLPNALDASQIAASGSGDLDLLQADINDGAAVRSIMSRLQPELVIHAAAVTPLGPEDESANFQSTIGTNVGGTAAVLEAAAHSRARRFIYVSSSAVYGGRRSLRPLTEVAAVRPTRTYGITKYAGELLSLRYGSLHNISVTVVRIQSPYGPWEQERTSRPVASPVHNWCLAAIGGTSTSEPINLPRNWTFVRDAVDGLLAVALSERPQHRLYNVASSRLYWYSDVLSILKDLVPEFTYQIGPKRRASAADDIRGPLAVERIRDEFSWSPSVTLKEGLQLTLEWMRPRFAGRLSTTSGKKHA